MEKVLNDGFVKLVDYMGSDQRILDAARVSTGSDSKGDEADAGLIRYLLKNEHTSPFEKVVFEFHIRLPIFVARQWMRHRTGCVIGESKIHLDNKKSESIETLYRLQSIGKSWSFQGQIWKQRFTIFDKINDDQIYNCLEISNTFKLNYKKLRYFIKKYGTIDNRKSKNINAYGKEYKKVFNMIIDGDLYQESTMWEKVKNKKVKFLNKNGFFDYTKIYDIYRNGIKDVYKVTLENGKVLTSSLDHKYLTKDGYKTLKDMCNPYVLNEKTLWGNNNLEIATNGIPAWRDYDYMLSLDTNKKTMDEIVSLTGFNHSTIKKWLGIHNLEYKKKPHNWKNNTWNKGLRYKFPPNHFKFSKEGLENIRNARSGKNSNWWKGGVSNRRLNTEYDNWIRNVRNNIFEKYGYECQLCNSNENLELHHIIPFYSDNGKLMDDNNLIPLCKDCHRKKVTNNEEKYIEIFSKKTGINYNLSEISKNKKEIQEKINTKLRNRVEWSRIRSIEYIGKKEVFDLGIKNSEHNYIVNGIVTHNSFNEVSARYKELECSTWRPEEWRKQGTKNHQMSSDEKFSELENQTLFKMQSEAYLAAEDVYREMLDMGVAREIARSNMPVGQYTEFYWTVNYHNLMHFLTLRNHSHAQPEIQVYGQAIEKILSGLDDLKWSFDIYKKVQELRNLFKDALNKYKDLDKLKQYLKDF